MKGIGFDLVEIARLRKIGRSHAFFKKVFTAHERKYCFSYGDPFPHLAGIFAAKEATAKVLDARKIHFTAVEIRHNKNGRPEVWLGGRRLSKSFVSISHARTTAGAVVTVA
jgi:holo-[acyl-carrier protein] synthase